MMRHAGLRTPSYFTDLFGRLRKTTTSRMIAAILLAVITTQAFGFFNLARPQNSDSMTFEVCTANGMMSMADNSNTDQDTPESSQGYHCVFCAMSHALAVPILAVLLFFHLPAQTYSPLPTAFVFHLSAPEWVTLPARAPPSRFISYP